ncbi:hypothetical protein API480_5 [Paenibacillus phage vB_PlaP_API480]|nr:hypothetical protein API480_5 [Paenibacillus phage vB_PlaP_API480]
MIPVAIVVTLIICVTVLSVTAMVCKTISSFNRKECEDVAYNKSFPAAHTFTEYYNKTDGVNDW